MLYLRWKIHPVKICTIIKIIVKTHKNFNLMWKCVLENSYWKIHIGKFVSDIRIKFVLNFFSIRFFLFSIRFKNYRETNFFVCNSLPIKLNSYQIVWNNIRNLETIPNALPGTLYGISENGWMTSEVFSEWFHQFCDLVTERPLLLILGGHLTHVSIPVIMKGMEEDVTILKLPPHVTDVLQPLDVTCFRPLKRAWETMLNKWVNEFGAKEPIRKGIFVNKLGEVWHQGLSEANVKAGFSCTGIYPVDKTKYPAHRFDPRLVRRYENWVAAGKPDSLEDVATAVNTPSKSKRVTTKNAAKIARKDATENKDVNSI